MSAWATRAAASVALASVIAGAAAGAPDVTSDSIAAGPDTTAVESLRTDSTVIASPAFDSSAVEGLPIARVEVLPRNIYDPTTSGRLGPLYRLANRLHVRTRSYTVRQLLLFAPGEPWRVARGRETERSLRALDFLTPDPIRARRERDSVVVTVGSRDLWTTSPEFNIESASGKSYGSLAITERNLFGLGKSLSVSYREEPNGSWRAFSYGDPNVLGSRIRFRYQASSAAIGANDQILVGLPFYAEDTPHAYGVSWNRVASEVQLFESGRVAAALDRNVRESEAYWARGVRTSAGIERLVYSLYVRDRYLGPSRVAADAPPGFEGEEETLRLRRVAVEGRLWRPRFIDRANVDRMHMVEDFHLGTSIGLKLGLAPKAFGSTANEGYGNLDVELGAVNLLGFGWLRAGVSSRFRGDARETIERYDARWVNQSLRRQTLVLAANRVAGSRVARDFQLVAGGLNGLRAYPVQATAGTAMWRLNAEHRWIIGENLWQTLTVGTVAFADAARATGLGSAGGDWFVGAGTGLRIAMPQWSLSNVVRIDVAWPLEPTRDGQRAPVLSFGSSQAF